MMNKQQACTVIENELKPLWPKWQINKPQLEVWVNGLQPFDYAVVKQAAHRHYADRKGVYLNPQLSDIVERAKALTPKPKQVKKNPPADFEPTVFVQCVENKKYPERIYSYHPVYVRAEFRDDKDYVLAAAENMRKGLEYCYDGSWRVIQQTTARQMLDEFMNHRQKQRKPKNKQSAEPPSHETAKNQSIRAC